MRISNLVVAAPLLQPNHSLILSLSEPNGEWVMVFSNNSVKNPKYDLYFFYGVENLGEAKKFDNPTLGLYGRILNHSTLEACIIYVAETCGENITLSWRKIPETCSGWFRRTPEEHKEWFTYSERLVEVTN